MIDEEIASVLDDAGYQFNIATRRYDVTTGATEGEEEGHSSTFVADELGIPEEDLARWEEERLAEAGMTGEAGEAGEAAQG